ncbi:hypothetical protein GE21DRAFT_1109544 [Neurospora crassa]|nr:hypothetical protein GE21DRAFT_1109544 [Neurospora crassa]
MLCLCCYSYHIACFDLLFLTFNLGGANARSKSENLVPDMHLMHRLELVGRSNGIESYGICNTHLLPDISTHGDSHQ